MARIRWLALSLFAFVLLGNVSIVHATSTSTNPALCSFYPTNASGFHVIDGNDPALTVLTLPTRLGIDTNCYFKNFPLSDKWPEGLTSTVNFNDDGFLAIFENLYYSGNMACANTSTKIWFVNNAYYDPGNSCQDLFIPVETIGKAVPGPSAAVGVPFTYTLTVPVMYDPATNTYYLNPSVNTLSNATIYEDLTATGASMTYVSNTAYLVNGATRIPLGTLALGANASTLSALGIPLSNTTKNIVFSSDNNPSLANIVAGTQVEIQMTVVLDNVPTNTAGTQFINTAKWWFGRVIDGVAYSPLPGQSGVSDPMTIVEPSLTMVKTSTFTNLNVGTAAPFKLNVQNAGGGDAWNTTITDILPPGMCSANPVSTVSARIYASDGVTPVTGVLVSGTDYTVNYSGCTLTVTLTDTTKIAPTQRLIINYNAQLDAGTAAGLTLINVTGATRWFSGLSTNVVRRQYDRTLTNGTPGTLDFQDAYTITSATQGYFFLKSVGNLTTGEPVTTTAFPGDLLRYTLQIQNFTFPVLRNIEIIDDFDALNVTAAFVPGTLALASVTPPLPAGAVLTVSPTGGSKGTGSFTITGLNLASNAQYQLQFDIRLVSGLANDRIVFNQASLTGTDSSNVIWTGVSDDPYVNGPSLLSATGDITPVQIYAPGALSKANTQPTATIGEQFKYRITVPADPVNVPLYDVRILDTLAANLSYVSAAVVSGGTWSMSNTGTASNLVIEDAAIGIDIPALGQAVIEITVAMQNTELNQDGVTFTNTSSYTYNKINGDTTTQGTGGAGTTAPMTVVEPNLTISKAVSYVAPAGKLDSAAANPGDVLQYTVTIINNGTSDAYDADVLDTLPSNLALVTGSATATINGVAVSGFVITPTTLASGALVWGAQNGDGSLDIPVGQTLVLSYRATVLSANGTDIINSAYTSWASLDGDVIGQRNGGGCPSVTALDNYCAGAATATVTSIDPTALAKAVASDSWTTAPSTASDATLRVGDTVIYTLTATLLEGTTQNVVIADTLPTNMVFDSVVSINGDTVTPYSSVAPFTYSNFTGPVISGSTSTWSFGNITNAIDNNATNNGFVIQYRARVVNTLPQSPPTQLINNATLNYAIGGLAATPKSASATLNVWQPLLNVSKSAAPAERDTVLVAGELVTYTVSITNTGAAPAYNPVLQDILPSGMRNTTPLTTSVTIGGAAVPVIQPTYLTGVATWNFVSTTANQYTIPAGATLTVVYQAYADEFIGAGTTLTNEAQVMLYYSLDSLDASAAFRKVYGATGIARVTLTTATPTALSKLAMVASAAMGQPFTYEIRVPATPLATASLFDVRVLDDISLATTGVSLNYLSSSAWLASNPLTLLTLTNNVTTTNLILEDTTLNGGLDILAGDQLIVTVTLVLANDPVNNTAGKQFTNTADYTYNSSDNVPATQATGGPGSAAMTIVAPNLIMQKSGPATMRGGVPDTFTLNVLNTGVATAWNAVITDILPNVTTAPVGGMCATPPTVISVGVHQNDGTLITALVKDTHFSESFVGCTLTITVLNSVGAIAPNNRMIVSYSASLDSGTANGITLTNVAGATQWISSDPNVNGATGNVHTFSNTLTNGTPGVTDFQDAFTLTTEAPVLTFTKTAFNVTTGQSGANARPGDTLRYTVEIKNISDVPATDFSLTDDLDALNTPAMFEAGSLALVLPVPVGASTVLTSSTGGTKGTGLVSISGLNVDAQGGTNPIATIVFTVRLVPVITSGTVVLNQARIVGTNLATQLSDDPDPLLVGTNPTRTLIASAPAWRVLKTVQNITSGTSVVLPSDVLRYTITVKNIGTENATGVTLTDAIPDFTTYVAGSTRLNGNLVGDPVAGVSALPSGMLINATGNTTPGVMNADATVTPSNVATITFDARVNTSALSGTIISNQGFVNGSGQASGAFPVAPSDDPATAALNDPTRVIIGNLPLLNATKTVALPVPVDLLFDINGNGVIDPGDIVRYTITVNNYSSTPATGVRLTDATPINTTYVANTVFLDGVGVGQLDGGVSPLLAGIAINSLGAAAGTIAGGGQAVVTFNVQVAGGTGGMVISNQGAVTSAQLPTLLTDADGNPSNGYQATTFVVGSAQQVSITKQVSVVGGGAALPGSQLEYLVTVTNTGTVVATNVVITDDLSLPPLATQVIYVETSARLNGSTTGVEVAGSLITATQGTLAVGATAQLRFRVTIAAGLLPGTIITNTGQVAWNAGPTLTATASASIAVGDVPGSISLNGRVWHDANFNNVADGGELNLDGWSVGIYRNNTLLGSVFTNADGLYSASGLAPVTTAADQYTIRFLAPGAVASSAKLGLADSPYINGMQEIRAINTLTSILQNLNLPIDPSGVVYNSILRTPATGVMLTMVRVGNSTRVPDTCFEDPLQQDQVTLASGYYKFDMKFGDLCPAGDDYLIRTTSPATYMPGESLIIPPVTGATTPAVYSVTACAADAVSPTPAGYCEAQGSERQPGLDAPNTNYYLKLSLSNPIPGGSQLFNNHIAVDPRLDNAFTITKIAALQNVTKGQLIPYTITLSNTLAVDLNNMSIVDSFPPGFKYIKGSGRLDGVNVEPVSTTTQLAWGNLQLASKTKRVIQLMLIVGSGVKEGKYVNRAQVYHTTLGVASPVAAATVRVIPDPTLDCSDVIGKVFDDANLNGYQDEGELGLPGVRVVSARGLITTADKFGRFHLTCAVVPDPDRGSNFILKVDDRSLPSGYRLTSENPLVLRATRGKMLKFNFGAVIHKVVKLDMADDVFEPGTTEMRVQWKQRIELLIRELKKAASVLRLSYLAETEDESLVNDRIKLVKEEVAKLWREEKEVYDLTIETEVFWRTGAPPEKSVIK